MQPHISILFFLHKTGPYHKARFRALAKSTRLTVVEILPSSNEYDWQEESTDNGYQTIRIEEHRQGECLKGKALLKKVSELIDTSQPNLIITTGWSNRTYMAALWEGKKRKIPVVSVTDSTYGDVPRHWLTEKLKQPIVRSFDGFIAAGKRATAYLQTFDINVPVTQPWDVVDNDYFINRTIDLSLKYRLPPKYILHPARFISEKNHIELINGYAQYKKKTDKQIKLIIIGSGPLKENIHESIRSNNLTNDVIVFNFIHQDEITYFFKNAMAIILPSISETWGLVINEAMACGKPVIVSNRCGCVDDLVVNGENGWVIEPTAQRIAECLQQLAATNSETLHQMGQYSLNRLNGFRLEDFSKAVTSLVTDNNLKSNQNWYNKFVLFRIYM